MSNKSAKRPTSKVTIRNNLTVVPDTPPNSLYSGTPNAARAILRARAPRSRNSTRSRRVLEYINNDVPEKSEIPLTYHPWRAQYHPIIIREKLIKPMAKDPYTQMRRLACHAVETVTTDVECCPALVAPEAVKSAIVNVQTAPRKSVPNIVRFIRRTEPMPSERFILPPINRDKISALPNSQYGKPTFSTKDTSKMTGIAPHLTAPNRLLNRPKIQNDASLIRRPQRKLIQNVSHETVMPLSVYG